MMLLVPDVAGDESEARPGAAGPNVISDPSPRDPIMESDPALDSIVLVVQQRVYRLMTF